MGIEKVDLNAQLYETRRRFNRACHQIVHLGVKLSDLNQRYLNAKSNNNQVFRRSLRLRLITLEGLVKTFTHYACMKKNEVLELRSKLAARRTVFMEQYSDTEEEYRSDGESTSDGEYSTDEE